jgi:Alginate export
MDHDIRPSNLTCYYRTVSIRVCVLTTLALIIGVGTAAGQAEVQTSARPSATAPSATPTNQSSDDDSLEWLFPIDELDDSLPSWVSIGGEYRGRVEGPSGIKYKNNSDFYLLDRLRVWVAIQPKEWLLFKAQVQDSRIFFNHHTPNGNPYEDSWTLWEGYAQAGSSTSGWVDVLGGRQVLRFGDERIIGPSDWTNVGRTFNVARVDIHQPGFLVSVFASSVVPGEGTDLHNAIPGNNLYGVYGSFKDIVPKATFEPYVLWSVAPSNSELSEEVGHGRLNEVTIGLHWEGNLPRDFDYDTEFDGQTGSLGTRSIRAWAGFASMGKTFRETPLAPRVFLEGNYASGTKNPAGHDWNTFDMLYPSNHDKEGFADQVGRRNLVQFRTGVEEEPTKKWKLKQQFEGFWLATPNDNFYASSGAIAVPSQPGASRHIGNELDLVAEYTLTRGLNFGFGYARLFAGRFLKTTTPGRDYSYPYAYFEYNFSRSGFHFPLTPKKPN